MTKNERRTLVEFEGDDNIVTVRTVSARHGRSSRFIFGRGELERLAADPGRTVLSKDLLSFCEVYREADLVRFRFSWLSDRGVDRLEGRRETVPLAYAPFAAFLESCDGPERRCWRTLSVDLDSRRPVLDFSARTARETLHRIAALPSLRRKFAKGLRDSFQWPCVDRVRFVGGPDPYGFEFRLFDECALSGSFGPQDCRSGGLVKTRYVVHT